MIVFAPRLMSQNITHKRRVEEVTEGQSLLASLADCGDTSLAPDEDSEQIVYVKRVRVPRGDAAGLCLPPGPDRVGDRGSQQHKRKKLNPPAPAPASLPRYGMDPPDDVMSISRPSSPQPQPQALPLQQAQPQAQTQQTQPPRRHLQFPDGHGKTLA